MPSPTPQLVVTDAGGVLVGRVDLGWEAARVALEYQGDQHRTDRARWRRDQARFAALAACGRLVLPFTADDPAARGRWCSGSPRRSRTARLDQGHTTRVIEPSITGGVPLAEDPT